MDWILFGLNKASTVHLKLFGLILILQRSLQSLL